MVRVALTRPFLKSVKKLPAQQQNKLVILLAALGEDPFSPLLHTKPLSGKLAGHYSFRIGRDWRVVFRFVDPEIISVINASHRRDVYR